MSRPSPLTPSLVLRLYEQSRATRWGLGVAAFQTSLEASVAHAFPGQEPTSDDLARYVASLHTEDLALASACAAGLDRAWDDFVREHRPALYRAADAIDPAGGARDLADALYADLFGLQERAGIRQSLFRYYHGRSRLTTWLRAVLAQRHVDRVRAGRRLEPLPDDAETIEDRSSRMPLDPEYARLAAAVQAALVWAVSALAPRDRLLIGCYYVQNLKLAAIGRLVGDHEATVSRHLSRTRAAIRSAVERRLREHHGLNAAAIAQGFEAVASDAGALDLAELVGVASSGPATRKNTGPDRSR